MISACMTVSVRELRTAVREWACWKRVIWICFFTPPTLLHSVFTQNFQRPGLLWLRVNETGLKPLGEPMPKFFSGLDLVCFFLQGVELLFFLQGVGWLLAGLIY